MKTILSALGLSLLILTSCGGQKKVEVDFIQDNIDNAVAQNTIQTDIIEKSGKDVYKRQLLGFIFMGRSPFLCVVPCSSFMLQDPGPHRYRLRPDFPVYFPLHFRKRCRRFLPSCRYLHYPAYP